jgi:hypothetical protein
LAYEMASREGTVLLGGSADQFPHATKATDIRTCRGLTSSVPASLARMSRSRGRGLGSKENAQDCFTTLRESCKSFDPLGFSSRMFPDFSVQTKEETLQKSSAFSWSSAGMGFAGVCLTASFSESPNVARVCSLSDVLESHVPPRFFLSARAARGILKRAAVRGRELPPKLLKALLSLSNQHKPEATDGDFSATEVATPLTPTLETLSLFTDDKIQSQINESASHLKPELDSVSPSPRTSAANYEPAASAHSLHAEEASQGKDTQRYLSPTLSTKNEVASSSTQREAWMQQCAEMLMTVRRLTPTECETLQAFRKGWTLPATEHWGTRSRVQSRSGSRKESSK